MASHEFFFLSRRFTSVMVMLHQGLWYFFTSHLRGASNEKGYHSVHPQTTDRTGSSVVYSGMESSTYLFSRMVVSQIKTNESYLLTTKTIFEENQTILIRKQSQIEVFIDHIPIIISIHVE
jgi:hypothetical protein